jgi:hypothetical protein
MIRPAPAAVTGSVPVAETGATGGEPLGGS